MNEKQRPFLRKLSTGILLPVLLLVVAILMGQARPVADPTPTEPSDPTKAERGTPILTVVSENEVRTMQLDGYLVGVLLGEMPATFETEALRAQAVAARTYALRQAIDGEKHGKNAVCTDSNCCQAFFDPLDYIAVGGSEWAVERMEQAVHDTKDQVLLYDGKLIEATYFSCAGGATEDAVAVWGEEYPYLQSVPSLGEEEALYYTDTQTFSAEEFQKALGIRLEGAVEKWFGQPTYTSGGGVDTLPICGIPYRGTTLRSLLGLRSTAFTVSVEAGQIVFHTKGSGHRVGMSQYGANAMAKAGKNHRQILTYYYTDIEIVQIGDETPEIDKIFS